MASNLEKYKSDLDALIKLGRELVNSVTAEERPEAFEKSLRDLKPDIDFDKVRKSLLPFKSEYQTWYSEAKALIKQVLPDRLDDFTRHYEKPRNRKTISFESYRIEDGLQGLQVTKNPGNVVIVDSSAMIPHVLQQIHILESVKKRFESSLFDIKLLVQAELFDSEIAASHELKRAGYLRAAGVVAGVILEKHLFQVLQCHSLSLKKTNPTIGDFNDSLKSTELIDTPTWRKIQHLADIRNICCHGKDKEPTLEQVEELISGVDAIVKTVF